MIQKLLLKRMDINKLERIEHLSAMKPLLLIAKRRIVEFAWNANSDTLGNRHKLEVKCPGSVILLSI